MKEYGEVLENIDLKKYNTYGVGGKAKYLIRPQDISKLQQLIIYLQKNNIPWYILGSGSNVILPDEDFNGAIIKIDKMNKYVVNNDIITVEAGISLANLVEKMLADGYINYGNLMGIPGLLGGAIVGNAGAYGTAIFDYLKSITVIDSLGILREINKEDIKYDYRYTEFKNSKNIIVSAQIIGLKGDVVSMKEHIKENMLKRKNTQPLATKNAGSVFANPPGVSAGYLIEHAGLKGLVVGGAQVSSKHANFIINFNNASSHDIISLIDIIKNNIKKQYKIELKLEQVQVKW